jgi:hypothetical protein
VGGTSGMHRRGQRSVQGFGESPKERDHSEDPRRRWEAGIKMDVKEIGWEVCRGFSWLRLGTGGQLL